MSDGNQYRKVQSGQRRHLPAAVWNAMLETIDYVQSLRDSGGTQGGGSITRGGLIPVKNTSGADVGRFHVLGIDDVLYSPSDDLDEFLSRPALKGVVPALANHAGRFAVMAEPAANNEIGLAMVSGITPVKVQVNAGDEDLQYADVHNGNKSHLLLQSSGSASIFWREPGTGEKWALARIGNKPANPIGPAKFVLARLNTNLTTSTASVYGTTVTWFDGSEPAATVLLYNKPIGGSPAYEFSGSAGDYVYAFYSPVDDAYIISSITPPGETETDRWALVQIYTLTTDDASTTATVLDSWDGVPPAPIVTVLNPPTGVAGKYMFAGVNGTVGLACYNPTLDAYVLVYLPPTAPSTLADVIEFSLLSTLSTSDREVRARVIHYHGGDSPGREVTLINGVNNGDETEFLFSAANGSCGVAVRGSNGKYVIVAFRPPNAGTATSGFCVAEQNWQRNGNISFGSHDFVLVTRIADPLADPVARVGGSFYVILTKSASRDPNVVASQILGYSVDPLSGYAFCTTDYLDDKIGTLKWSDARGEIEGGFGPMMPVGWELVTAAEGLTLVAEGFVAAVDPLLDSLYGSDQTSGETTGVTVDDHANHHHAQQFNAVTVGGSGASVNSAWSTTGNESATQTHTVEDNGHSHTVEIPHKKSFLIRRINNSYSP
jgi:hypothetical protein